MTSEVGTFVPTVTFDGTAGPMPNDAPAHALEANASIATQVAANATYADAIRDTRNNMDADTASSLTAPLPLMKYPLIAARTPSLSVDMY